MNVQFTWQLAGWTMIHYLWIGLVLLAATAVVRLILRGAPPTWRYAQSLVALAAIAIAPLLVAVWVVQQDGLIEIAAKPRAELGTATVSPPSAVESVTPLVEPPPRVIDLKYETLEEDTSLAEPVAPADSGEVSPIAATDASAALPVSSTSTTHAATVLPSTIKSTDYGHVFQVAAEWLPWVWVVGAPLTFLLLASGLVGVRRLRRSATLLSGGPVVETGERLRTTLRVSRQVAFAVSDKVLQPVLVGIVRPIILLPSAAVTGWTPAQLEMALVHELAHVRRYDNLVNLLQRVIESLLFFQPAVWISSRWLRIDREQCCDAVVVRHTGQRESYAELLLDVAQVSLNRRLPSTAVALARRPLVVRIRRILQLEDDPMLVSRSTFCFAGLVILVATAIVLWQPNSDTIAQNFQSGFSASSGEQDNDQESDDSTDGFGAEFEEGEGSEFDFDVADDKRVQEAEISFELADDPSIFASPQAHHNWQVGVTTLVKSHEVLNGAMQRMLEHHKTARNRLPLPPESWLREELTVSFDEKGRIVLSLQCEDKSREELLRILRFVGESYVQVKRNADSENAKRARSPFLPLEQQRIADLAYSMLNIEIEPVAKEDLPENSKFGFAGGVRVTQVVGRPNSSGISTGDILVGLHVWATEDFDALAEVLRRDDLDEFNPLKYYILRPKTVDADFERGEGGMRGGGGRGGFGEGGRGDEMGMMEGQPSRGFGRGGREGGGGEMGGGFGEFGRSGGESQPAETVYQLVTGRISFQPDAWSKEQQRLSDEQETSPTSSDTDGPNFRNIGGEESEVGVPFEGPPFPSPLSADGKQTLLYDGRTFDAWTTQWKTELKTENRTDAIKALRAFGRAGHGEQAARVILEVADEYQFGQWGGDISPQQQLVTAIVTSFVDQNDSNPIPPEVAIPVVLERYKENPKLRRAITKAVLDFTSTKDPAIWKAVAELGDDDNPTIRRAVAQHLANSDIELKSEITLNLLKKQFHDADEQVVINALRQLTLPSSAHHAPWGMGSFGHEMRILLPELLPQLFDESLEVRKAARKVLSVADENQLGDLPGRLARIAENPIQDAGIDIEIDGDDPDSVKQARLSAIRALAALGPLAKPAYEPVKSLLESEDYNVRVAAYVVMERMFTHGGGNHIPEEIHSQFNSIFSLVTEDGVTDGDAHARFDRTYSVEKDTLLPADGRFGGGGGLGGRGQF